MKKKIDACLEYKIKNCVKKKKLGYFTHVSSFGTLTLFKEIVIFIIISNTNNINNMEIIIYAIVQITMTVIIVTLVIMAMIIAVIIILLLREALENMQSVHRYFPFFRGITINNHLTINFFELRK